MYLAGSRTTNWSIGGHVKRSTGGPYKKSGTLKLIKESEHMCMYEFEEECSQFKNNTMLVPYMNDLINKYKVDPVFFYEINGVYTLSLDLKLIEEDLDYIKNRFNKTDIHDNFTDGKMIVDEDEVLIRKEKEKYMDISIDLDSM